MAVSGGDNNLQVAIAPYDPKDVHCGNIGPPGSTVPPIYSCKNVVDNMPTSKDLEAFGKMGSTPQPEVTLPAYKVCTFSTLSAFTLLFPSPFQQPLCLLSKSNCSHQRHNSLGSGLRPGGRHLRPHGHDFLV